MKIALDTYYTDDEAVTCGLEFKEWTDKVPFHVYRIRTKHNFGPYIPGKFYKRELPCLQSLLGAIDLTPIDTIVLDSYLDIGGDGLGVRMKALYPDFEYVGVAKSKFQGAKACEVLRGESRNPLYVQSFGMTNEMAGDLVKNMYGKYRIPFLLKILDKETKK